MAVIEATELYRFYHSGDAEVVALRGVTLSLSAGEIVALVGPSGSGKSTLLNLLAGLDEPDGGHVDIAGSRLSRRAERVRTAIRAQHVGIVMQSANLVEHLTVADNIQLARRLARKPASEAMMTQLLSRMGLAAHRDGLPAQLSGGEAARAALAVALAAEPLILLCDEPTAEVDAETEQRVIADLIDSRATGVAILIATHSTALQQAADRQLRLCDGRLA